MIGCTPRSIMHGTRPSYTSVSASISCAVTLRWGYNSSLTYRSIFNSFSLLGLIFRLRSIAPSYYTPHVNTI